MVFLLSDTQVWVCLCAKGGGGAAWPAMHPSGPAVPNITIACRPLPCPPPSANPPPADHKRGLPGGHQQLAEQRRGGWGRSWRGGLECAASCGDAPLPVPRNTQAAGVALCGTTMTCVCPLVVVAGVCGVRGAGAGPVHARGAGPHLRGREGLGGRQPDAWRPRAHHQGGPHPLAAPGVGSAWVTGLGGAHQHCLPAPLTPAPAPASLPPAAAACAHAKCSHAPAGCMFWSAQEAVWGAFVGRVRDNLHIVLTMSPVGDAFRTRWVT